MRRMRLRGYWAQMFGYGLCNIAEYRFGIAYLKDVIHSKESKIIFKERNYSQKNDRYLGKSGRFAHHNSAGQQAQDEENSTLSSLLQHLNFVK